MSELVLGEQGEVVLVDDDPLMYVYNLSLDEWKNNIVHAWRDNFPNDHASSTFMKERVIVLDVRMNLVTIVDATLAYARAMSSNVKFLLAENEKIAKNLQVAKKKA